MGLCSFPCPRSLAMPHSFLSHKASPRSNARRTNDPQANESRGRLSRNPSAWSLLQSVAKCPSFSITIPPTYKVDFNQIPKKAPSLMSDTPTKTGLPQSRQSRQSRHELRFTPPADFASCRCKRWSLANLKDEPLTLAFVQSNYTLHRRMVDHRATGRSTHQV